MTNRIRIVGPRESKQLRPAETLVWTVSNSASDWQRDLSPFILGPVPLYGGRQARSMENGWQFAKLYAVHADEGGEPTPAYWRWAENGWRQPAMRYPMGKGAKPLCCLWDGERLGYIDARKQVYWRLYRDAVRETPAWRRLQAMHADGDIALFDYDGFDHDAGRMPLAAVIEQDRRPMGHAFVLKAMLIFGPSVEADEVVCAAAAPEPQPAGQAGLFDDTPAPLAAPARARPR